MHDAHIGQTKRTFKICQIGVVHFKYFTEPNAFLEPFDQCRMHHHASVSNLPNEATVQATAVRVLRLWADDDIVLRFVACHLVRLVAQHFRFPTRPHDLGASHLISSHLSPNPEFSTMFFWKQRCCFHVSAHSGWVFSECSSPTDRPGQRYFRPQWTAASSYGTKR